MSRNMPPVIRCDHCHLPYYQTSAAHVCAGGVRVAKEEAMRHEKQITDYPKGARVEAVVDIPCHDGPILRGTKGTVNTHTLDGRAYVFFDDHNAGHTFHEPERYIRVVCNHKDEQCPANHEHEPAARGECDVWTYNFSDGEYHVREQGNGDCIAHTKNKQYAARIIRDHALAQLSVEHTALVEQRDRAVRALREIAAFDDAGANLILRKNGSYSGFDEPGAVQLARETLAALNEHEQGGGA